MSTPNDFVGMTVRVRKSFRDKFQEVAKDQGTDVAKEMRKSMSIHVDRHHRKKQLLKQQT